MDAIADPHVRFAHFVATLGRGPGRGRALTRAEAREAFTMVLAGEADPHQVGALLMLLRFRGEDGDEITGMVEAVRARAGVDHGRVVADLDWPSYGSGRTRGAPWFLLAALALARSGTRVLMHGSNDFTGGIPVDRALGALGLKAAATMAEAEADLAATRFAYLPLAGLSAETDGLLGLRRLFGLRSPVNTACRLINPGNAPAAVDGVFHPPYIEVHLGVAERMGRERLLVLKGGGGEAERVPVKPATAHLWTRPSGRSEWLLPVTPGIVAPARGEDTLDGFAAIWSGASETPAAVATVEATIGLGLLALGAVDSPEAARDRAAAVWRARH